MRFSEKDTAQIMASICAIGIVTGLLRMWMGGADENKVACVVILSLLCVYWAIVIKKEEIKNGNGKDEDNRP